MSHKIKPEDVSEVLISWAEDSVGLGNGAWDCVDVQELCAAIINAAIEAGLVSPPCHFIAYPSGMPVMYEPGEPIQIYPGKCSEHHHRHWKGQTE